MSGEIKILLYVLGGIVYIISTLYNKEKKKQQQKSVNKRPSDRQTAEDIFEELKKMIQPQGPEEKKENPPERKVHGKTKKEAMINIGHKTAREKEDKKMQLGQTLAEEPHLEHNRPEITDHVETIDKFELDFQETDPRKAFIYSEIFRRPRYWYHP
jgi:hypothetical protein